MTKVTDEEAISHLQLIAEHEGNDLSPNDKRALTHAIHAIETLAKVRAEIAAWDADLRSDLEAIAFIAAALEEP